MYHPLTQFIGAFSRIKDIEKKEIQLLDDGSPSSYGLLLVFSDIVVQLNLSNHNKGSNNGRDNGIKGIEYFWIERFHCMHGNNSDKRNAS